MADCDFLESFACSSFTATCRAIVEEYFEQQNFHVDRALSYAVRFSRNDVFVEFSHWPEDRPRFYLLVTIGILNARGPNTEEDVPAWWLKTRGKQPEDSATSEFRNAEQLEVVLRNMVPSTLVPLVEPLMNDKSRLRQEIDAFRDWADKNVH